MSEKSIHRFSGALAALILLFAAPFALAQIQTGNVYGKVTDEQGAGLPGVAVTLTGVGAPVTSVTNSAGEYRFLNLNPGKYTLMHSLAGFATVQRSNIIVEVARNTELQVGLKLAAVATEVTVTGESPLLDTRRTTTGANISQTELAEIPTARDPWVVLQSVPGILVDRINVGGNESGQQSQYIAKGSSGNAGTWNVDGVNITDVGAVGSSPTYYDFDSFQEMQVSTGGSDVTLITAGANLNMVTKRGTNDVHGSGRTFITDRRFQSDFDNEEAQAQGFTGGNRIDDIQDYGFELGGPLIADRLWLWGSYGRNQINLRTPATAANPNGFSDKTTLEDINVKLNAQPFDNNSMTGFYLRGDKIKLGRNAAPTRPQETTYDQKGPTTLWKFEDSHIFSPNFFATGLVSYIDGGFELIAEGGHAPYAYRSPDGVNHATYLDYYSVRPQTQVSGSANAFLRTGDIGHEFKFGFGYRTAPVRSSTTWPHGIRMIERTPSASGANRSYVRIYREGSGSYDTTFWSGYLSDTLTMKNLTINVGVRYDNQSGHARAATSAANPSFPDVIPTISQDEGSSLFEWENLSPRIGITYALGSDANKTLLRASYGRFVDNMPGSYNYFNSNVQYGYLWYSWNDANRDHIAQRPEVNLTPSGFLYAYNLNPDCLTCPNPNRVDAGLDSPTTDEIVIGAEKEVFAGIAISVAGTYRKYKNFTWTPHYGLGADGATHVFGPGDFVSDGTFDGEDSLGRPYSIPVYTLGPNAPGIAGRYLTNRPDYSQEYKGVEFQLNKRYSNKWAARVAFSYNDWTQDVGPGGVEDPTNQVATSIYGSNLGGSTDSGGQVMLAAGVGSGAKADVWINSRWNLNINGMYTLPYSFNVAANLFMREGYPRLFYNSDYCPDDLGCRNVLTRQIGQDRHPTVSSLDLRISKDIKVSALNITLSADCFNVFNSNLVLQRQSDLALTTVDGGNILETQSPRVFRFGARLAF